MAYKQYHPKYLTADMHAGSFQEAALQAPATEPRGPSFPLTPIMPIQKELRSLLKLSRSQLRTVPCFSLEDRGEKRQRLKNTGPLYLVEGPILVLVQSGFSLRGSDEYVGLRAVT